MSDQPKPGVKPQSNREPRSRPRRATATPPRPPSPTRPIEPGLVHYRVAEAILKELRDRAEKAGVTLDVGEFPPVTIQAESDDPQRPAKIMARIIARIADRFPMFRRVSRHFEGTDRRTGLFGDILAALVAIYKRNPETIEQLARQYKTELGRARAAKQASQNGGMPPASPPVVTGTPTEGVSSNAEA